MPRELHQEGNTRDVRFQYVTTYGRGAGVGRGLGVAACLGDRAQYRPPVFK